MELQALADDLFRCLEAFDPYAATYLVRDAVLDGVSVGQVVTDVLAPAQRRVGEQWQRGLWSIAQEHAATAIVDDLLGLLSVHVPKGRHGTVTLISAEGEWHVTPARMAALVWRSAGWQVNFLGGSIPAAHLHRSMGVIRADLVAISCTTPLALPGAARILEPLRRMEVPVLGGGWAFGPDRHRADALGLDDWVGHSSDAPALFERWMDRPPEGAEPLRTDDEELSLELQLPELIAAAERRLLQRWPVARSYDEQQRERTREDLGYILRFAAVSLKLDDDRVFHDFLGWLPEVLHGHGVPAEAASGGVDAVLGVLRDLPRTTSLLEAGHGTLEGAIAGAMAADEGMDAGSRW